MCQAPGELDRRGGTLVGEGIIDFPAFGKKTGTLLGKHRSRVGDFQATNDALPGGVLADEILTPGDIDRVLADEDTSIRSELRVDPLSVTGDKRTAYVFGGEEDRNGNGKLDTEDRNGNGELDEGEDLNGNKQLDTEDRNGNGELDHPKKGLYVTGPGPSPSSADGFLPLSLAFSFFFMWAISGSGQPSSMVRLMAFKDTITLRRSIFTVAMYYSMIYFPLVIIFCCARILLPGMENESDRIMPAMAIFLTENIGLGWLAGLLVAA